MSELNDVNETKNEAIENQESEEETKGKFYTEEEIALLEQKAGDKRISQYQKTLERKQKESEKLKNMSDADRREYEIEQREQALLEKEALLGMAENKSEGLSILAQKGLAPTLIDFVLDADAEKMYDKIKTIEKAFKASVKKEVENRLSSNTPKTAIDLGGITKDAFNKMSLSDKQKLYNEDPELFNALKSKN